MVRVGFVLNQIRGNEIEWLNDALTQVLTRDNNSLERLLKQEEVESNNNAIDILLLVQIDSTFHLDDLLGKIYSNAREVLMKHGLPLLPLNVLLGNFNKKELYWDHLFLHDQKVLNEYDIHFGTVERIDGGASKIALSHDIKPSLRTIDQDKYIVTALGGTFDHIHDGHKILLTVAAFLTSKRLIIGLTDQELLKNKKYKQYLESFSKRETNVMTFIHILKPQLKVEIIPLHDVCGPTGTVPEIECLVVSRETVEGADMVNETRKERGFSQLEVVVVNVLGGDANDGWKEKLSSTEVRKILATQP